MSDALEHESELTRAWRAIAERWIDESFRLTAPKRLVATLPESVAGA